MTPHLSLIHISGGKQPVRIVVDSRLMIPEDSRLVSSAGEYPLIVAALKNCNEAKKQKLEAVSYTHLVRIVYSNS